MKLWTRIRNGILTAAVVLALCAVGAYVLVSSSPVDYAPVELSLVQKETAARRFFQRVQEFHNAAEDVKPFAWSVSQDEVNEYLAAMDEIAYQQPDHARGEVDSAMAATGFASPAVAMHDGKLSIMVRSTKAGKVLWANVSFENSPDGQMRIRLRGAGAGCLGLPGSLENRPVESLKEFLAIGNGQAKTLRSVLELAGGKPFEPVFGFRKNRKVRIDAVEIFEGKLTLRLSPVDRKAPGGKTVTSPSE
jgi:hypothetical protein